MQKYVSYLALILSCLALASYYKVQPQKSPQSEYMLERLDQLETEIISIKRLLKNTTTADTTPTTSQASSPQAPASWPVVARRVAIDIKLNLAQADALDKILQSCHQGLIKASEHHDSIWRARLSSRARKMMTKKFLGTLNDAQKDVFKEWLKPDSNAPYTIWFLPEKPCGGCLHKPVDIVPADKIRVPNQQVKGKDE